MNAILSAFLVTASWAIAAAALGLWIGERGRRIDAQRREGVLPMPAPDLRRAEAEDSPFIRRPSSPVLRDHESVQQLRERLIADCQRHGFSEAECEEDADRMLAQMGHDRPDAAARR